MKGVLIMKEFTNVTEYQLLNLATTELLRRIDKEEKINEQTQKELGRDNRIAQHRLKIYNKQYEELRERIIELENNNAEWHRFGGGNAAARSQARCKF